MKLQLILRKSGISISLPLVFILVACGSSNEKSPERQTSNPSATPVQVTTVDVTPVAAVIQSAPTQQPIQTPEAIEGGTTDDSRSSLRDLIVGTWVSTDRDSRSSYDQLGFSFDGQVLNGDSVIGTYEMIGEHKVRITPYGNTARFSEPTIVTIINISPDSMDATGGFLEGGPMTRVKEVDDLARNLVGFWRIDSVSAESSGLSTSYGLFPIVRYDANGEFVPWFSYKWTHGNYEVFNNSTVLVQAGVPNGPPVPFTPFFVEEIAGDTATVRFEDLFFPAVSYNRLHQDKDAAKYLTGLWRTGDGTFEFTEDGRVIGDIKEGRFFVFDDGTVLLRYSEDYSGNTYFGDSTFQLVIESDDVAQLTPMDFDGTTFNFVSDPESAFRLNRVK